MKNKQENWEKLWSEFVVKEMCPAKCGHLRFKLKNLIKRILAQEKHQYRQEILEEKKEYKTLEQQIVELWDSRDIYVIKEKVTPLKNGKMKWTIIGKPNQLKKSKN